MVAHPFGGLREADDIARDPGVDPGDEGGLLSGLVVNKLKQFQPFSVAQGVDFTGRAAGDKSADAVGKQKIYQLCKNGVVDGFVGVKEGDNGGRRDRSAAWVSFC